MKSEFGKNIRVSIFGGSHEPHIGVTIYGLPQGTEIDILKLQEFLDRRAPREGYSDRREPDIPQFISGVKIEQDFSHKAVTDGYPLTAIIKNTDIRKEDYQELAATPRPGHADFTACAKYGIDFDMSGGGAFSGRMTAPLCIAGGIALQILEKKGIHVEGRLSAAGGAENELSEKIASAKEKGDSVGASISLWAEGVPAGLGGAMYDGAESRISSILFGIPAVKAVEFGAGVKSAELFGSENNDEFYLEENKSPLKSEESNEDIFSRIKTRTNNHGGILGGITSGMPILVRVSFKPTPSIALPQKTVNLKSGKAEVIKIKGRHDPCVGERAVPAAMSALAIAILDMMAEPIPRTADTLEINRQKIHSIDLQILRLLSERMEAAEEIAKYKNHMKLPVFQGDREEKVLGFIEKNRDFYTADYAEKIFKNIIEESRSFQERLIEKMEREPEAECALIGKNLSYSRSREIHEGLGRYKYDMAEVKENELATFIANKRYKGFNVTNPYKTAVIPMCHRLTKRAKETGVVNTIYRDGDSLVGANTDYRGFLFMSRRAGINFTGKAVLILGDGATSQTIRHAVFNQGAREIFVASRKYSHKNSKENIPVKYLSYENIERAKAAEIIINATPVGTWPNMEETIICLEDFPKCEGVLDVVYNPLRTKLILQGEEKGLKCSGGLPMLVAQALASAHLFLLEEEENIDDKEEEKNLETLLRSLEIKGANIVLIGMPGSGKTTFGAMAAKGLCRKFVDMDSVIEEKAGMTVPEIFDTLGEEGFRDLETAAARSLSRETGLLVACGGGAVLRRENMDALRQNGILIFLDCPIEALETKGRPLSKDDAALRKLYEERLPLYEKYMDYRVKISK